MPRMHPLLLLTALPLVACSSDDGSGTPEGTHYKYVVSEVKVPTSNTEAREIGLDLNGDKLVDNQLGMLLSTLKTYFDVQGAITDAVDQGTIILLADLQTTSFSSAGKGKVGLQVKLGENPNPPACADANDMVCRGHLTGDASFSVSASSPADAGVTGEIAGGTFNGGPGAITLEIALGDAGTIQLDLIGARAKASGMSETAIDTIVVGGAITEADLNDKIFPAVYDQVKPIVDTDCAGATLPDCACTGSTGGTILTIFDSAPKDCTVTLDEVRNNTVIKSLLAPDIEIDGTPALSLGVQVKAVKGSF